MPSDGRFTIPDGVFSRSTPRKQRPPEVDAWNVTVQRQLSNTMSVEAGYVGNKGRHVFVGDGPEIDGNTPTVNGFAQGVSRDLRRPFFAGTVVPPQTGENGAFGWTQGISIYYNQGQNWYNALQVRFTKRFADGYSLQANYTLQKAEQESGGYWIWDRDLEKGPADWDRTHSFNATAVYLLPFGREQRWGTDWHGAVDALLGGWQLNSVLTMQTGLPFTPTYADCGLDRDTGPCRPDLIGDAGWSRDARPVVQRRRRSAARAAPSAGRRAARSATSAATSCAAPGTGASMPRSSRTSRSVAIVGSRSASSASTFSTT